MLDYIVKRLIAMAVTMIAIVTITFVLMHLIPGGPFTAEKQLPEAVLDAMNKKYHLDDPLWKQYLDYLKGVLKFDLGPSFQHEGVSVNQLIKEGFPATFKIGFTALLAIIVLGIPLGILSALKHNRWQDSVIMVVATLGVSVPSFVVATGLIYVFSSKFNILPSNGLATWKHLLAPVIAISGFSLSYMIRLTRSSMLDVMHKDYIKTAKAKGLSHSKVVFKHALKNALMPVVTYLGPLIASLLTGSFVIEKIFAIPGIGKYFVESVGNRDYTVLMGITIFYGILVVLMVLMVDIIYGFIDPRIKMED